MHGGALIEGALEAGFFVTKQNEQLKPRADSCVQKSLTKGETGAFCWMRCKRCKVARFDRECG